MRKRFLSLFCASFGLFGLSSSFAQTDITPAKFIFKNQPSGAYSITTFGKGANPVPFSDNPTPGDLFGGLGGATLADNVFNQMKTAVTSGLSIVNSEFGNVLMLKGRNSTETLGTAATESFSAFFNINFAFSSQSAGTKLRTRAQFKIVAASTSTKAVQVQMMKGGNALSGAPTDAIFKGDTGWWKTEVDGTQGEDGVARARLLFPGAGYMDDAALYVYEMTITKDPVGLPSSSTAGLDVPEGYASSISSETTSQPYFVTWDKQFIYINGANNNELVSIYNMQGQLIRQLVASKGFIEIPVSRGAYIVKINNKTTKVII